MDRTESIHARDNSSSKTLQTHRNGNHSTVLQLPKRIDAYELGPELGRGGMGIVYAAVESKLNRKVALKVLQCSTAPSAIQLQRFKIEAQALAQLSHDNIVPVYHIGTHEDIRYYAMKYIEGNDLGHLLHVARRSLRSSKQKTFKSGTVIDSAVSTSADPRSSTPIGSHGIDLSASHYMSSMDRRGSKNAMELARSVALIGIQAADALHHAHERGIIHRDIKPSNLMLDEHNRVWITDFGLAQLRNSPSLTQTGDIVGTLRYMSPEQASGRRAFVDCRTDIYSLGVALYEIATLKRACPGQSAAEILREVTFERPIPLRKHNPRLPRDLETIIRKATERNPNDRYQSARLMADDLRRFVNHESLTTRRTSRWKYCRDWLYSRPRIAAGIAAITLLTIGLLSATLLMAQKNVLAKQQQITEKDELITQINAQRMLYLGQRELPTNPGRALALLINSANILPSAEADQAIMDAVNVNHEIATIDIHNAILESVRFSRDGTRIALKHRQGSQASVLTQFDSTDGTQLEELQPARPFESFAFSPDHRLVLLGGSQAAENAEAAEAQSTVVRTLGRPSLQKSFVGSSKAVQISPASFSPDGQRFVLPSSNNNAAVYDSNSFDRLYLLVGHEQQVLQCVFSDDGTRIATWGMDAVARIWDTRGENIVELAHNTADPTRCKLSFLAGGQFFYISSAEGTRVASAVDDSKGSSFFPERDARASVADDRLVLRGKEGIKVVNAKTRKVESVLKLKQPAREFVFFNHDRLVATLWQRSLHVYDVATGDIISECVGHEDAIAAFDGHPSDSVLVSVGYDGTLRLWNAYSDAERRVIETEVGRNAAPFSNFSSDGGRALFGSVAEDQTNVRQLLDLPDAGLSLPGTLVTTLDNRRLVTFSNRKIMLWDMLNARILAQSHACPEGISEAISFENRLICLSTKGRIVCWDIESDQVDSLIEPSESAGTIHIDRKGGLLYVGMHNGQLRSYQLSNYEPQILDEFESPIVDLSLDAAGSNLVLITKRNEIVTWNIGELAESFRMRDEEQILTTCNFVDAERFITHGGGAGSKITLWNASDGTRIAELACERVTDVALDDQRKTCAVASSREGIILWDLETQEKRTLSNQPCGSLAFWDNRLAAAQLELVSAAAPQQNAEFESASLTIWDVVNGNLQAESRIPSNPFALKINGEILVTCAVTYGVDVADLDETRVIAKLRGHTNKLVGATFTDDDSHVVSVGSDGLVLVHDLNNLKPREVGKHQHPVVCMAVSPDRQFLLTADQSGLVRQWDLATTALAFAMQFENPLIQMEIGEDNNSVVSVDSNHELKRWDLRSRELIDVAVDTDVRYATLAPDCQHILAILGDRKTIPVPSRKYQPKSNPEEQRDVVLINLANDERRDLSVSGWAIKGVFFNSGESIAILNSEGSAQVFDSNSLTEHSQTQSLDLALGLLSSFSKDEPTFYTAQHEQLTGWEPETGFARLTAYNRSTGKEATLELDHWMLSHPKSDWMIFLDKHGVRKRPINPVAYAETVAPRKLREVEVERLGLVPVN